MLVEKPEALWLAAVVALYALPVNAQDPAKPESPDWAKHTPYVVASNDTNRTQAIRHTLGDPLNSLGFEFQEAPLSEVVDFMRSEYQLEVQLDLQALDDLGLSPDEPISVNVRNISLASALKLMLRELDLVYVIDNEVLLVTTEDEALTRLVVAVYPVGDLLTPLRPADDDAETGDEPEGYDVDSLIDAIISCVAADTWVENGGPEAEIRPLQPGLLVIAQTQDVHEQIANLLAAIRQAKKHEFAVPHAEPQEAVRSEARGGSFGGGGGGFGGGGAFGAGFGGGYGEFQSNGKRSPSEAAPARDNVQREPEGRPQEQ